MAYSKYFSFKRELSAEYTRFIIRLVYSILMIILLIYTGFAITLAILASLLVLGSIFYKLYSEKDNKVVSVINRFEKEYEKGFSGKESIMTLMAFISIFMVVWVGTYFLSYSVEWTLILGFLALGVGNNFATLLLYFKKKQYYIYGTTIEFFSLGVLFNFLIFFLIGMGWPAALYLATVLHILLIIPWLDHNLSTPLITAIFYIILFI